MKSPARHEPVMVSEVLEFLNLKKGYTILDGTVGCGVHAGAILEIIGPEGLLIGVDRDKKSLEIAEKELKPFGGAYKLLHANFRDLDKVLPEFGVKKLDGALFDLGISSYQLGDAGRGFSFEGDNFLDMRMDTSEALRAYDIVNRFKKDELAKIIRDFGEERYYRRIADLIAERRKEKPISSTRELSELVVRAVGRNYRKERIHPATRTFQAIRIAVNRELDNLDAALPKAVGFLNLAARLCVISFHSLEDRIVKVRFREFEKNGSGRIITKKPVIPREDEKRRNPRSRSAKLRVFERG